MYQETSVAAYLAGCISILEIDLTANETEY
jgi:hypothetical protein